MRAFMMAAVVPSLLTLAPLGAAEAQKRLPTLGEVVERHRDLTGIPRGVAVQKYTLTRMTMPDGNTSIDTEQWVKPGKVRTRMHMPYGYMETATDGDVAWSYSPLTGHLLLDSAQAAELKKQAIGANVREVLRDTTRVTMKRIEGKPVYVAAVQTAAGPIIHYFDVKSGLQLGMDFPNQQKPGSRPMMEFSDYRRIEGILTATTMTVRALTGQVMTTKFLKTSFAPIHDSVFAMPAEVRALLKR